MSQIDISASIFGIFVAIESSGRVPEREVSIHVQEALDRLSPEVGLKVSKESAMALISRIKTREKKAKLDEENGDSIYSNSIYWNEMEREIAIRWASGRLPTSSEAEITHVVIDQLNPQPELVVPEAGYEAALPKITPASRPQFWAAFKRLHTDTTLTLYDAYDYDHRLAINSEIYFTALDWLQPQSPEEWRIILGNPIVGRRFVDQFIGVDAEKVQIYLEGVLHWGTDPSLMCYLGDHLRARPPTSTDQVDAAYFAAYYHQVRAKGDKATSRELSGIRSILLNWLDPNEKQADPKAIRDNSALIIEAMEWSWAVKDSELPGYESSRVRQTLERIMAK